MKTKFYLTENGNILNTEKGCFQTAGGQFLRRVFQEEMEYLVWVLTPIKIPKGFPEPELPIWNYLWNVKGTFLNKDYEYVPCTIACFTRQVGGLKREYCSIILPEYIHANVEIVDTDESPIYIEDEDLTYSASFHEAELINYARKESVEDVYHIGKPDFEERVRRYKILKSLGIKLPYEEHLDWLKRRRVKAARKATRK